MDKFIRQPVSIFFQIIYTKFQNLWIIGQIGQPFRYRVTRVDSSCRKETFQRQCVKSEPARLSSSFIKALRFDSMKIIMLKASPNSAPVYVIRERRIEVWAGLGSFKGPSKKMTSTRKSGEHSSV